MFRFPPGAKLCKQVSVIDGTLRVESLDGKIAEMRAGTPPPPKEKRKPAQISMTPLDKKFRRQVARKITELCDESVSKEDFRNRLTHFVDKMLKGKRSALIRLEKE